MTGESHERVLQWRSQDPDDVEDKVAGEVEVLQPLSCSQRRENNVVVTRRPSQSINTVSLACIDRFSSDSWEKIRVRKPRHNENIRLYLRHRDFDETLGFEFVVDENEVQDIVVGAGAIRTIDTKWVDRDGRLYIIIGSKKKNVEQISPIVVAANKAEDKEEEKRRRQARLHALSTTSTGSSGSAGSSVSAQSTGSTAQSN